MNDNMEKLKTLLIANRGEIAVRLARTAKKLNIKTVALYTDSDSASKHVSAADEAYLLSGPPGSAYTDSAQIIEIARKVKANAIIPGYGFLSENADFARSCEEAGIAFVGPQPESIEAFGIKHVARELAEKAGVPIVPGTKGLVESVDEAVVAADDLGYPVMLKATGGGGGMGLITCYSAEEVKKGFEVCTSRGTTLFKNPGVFLERYYPASHHIEVQIFGNGQGHVVHYGERECSIQRRHQKVIEECPSPLVSDNLELRSKLTQAAVALAKSVNYESAGTVEYLVDDETKQFFFLEMNTRLQVEHGITEMCYGVDLVELMLRQADARLAGHGGLTQSLLDSTITDGPNGVAIEARVYAENPVRDFSPSPGLLQEVHWGSLPGSRIDTWVFTGTRVSPYYDSMLAKVMFHSATRKESIEGMQSLIKDSSICGPPTNMDFLQAILESGTFASGRTLTTFLNSFQFKPSAIEVLRGGAYTLVEDFGRPTVGHGVPRAGAMDTVAYQIANMLVGNKPGVESLEITLEGPELLFHAPAVVAITGATIEATLDGQQLPLWTRVYVAAGQHLNMGKLSGNGCRSYLGVYGGFDNVAVYFESKSTSPLVGIGGYQGRQLAPGDLLSLTEDLPVGLTQTTVALESHLIPVYQSQWEILSLVGPYSSGYLLPESLEALYSAEYKISHNASRAGIRLSGPTPKWARADGGDGGFHPSNIMEYGYSTGALNWTGDDGCLLPFDSPNFGGFLSSNVVIRADWWKMGQLRPGSSLRFRAVTYDEALAMREKLDNYITTVQESLSGQKSSTPQLTFAEATKPPPPPPYKRNWTLQDEDDCVIWSRPTGQNHPEIKFRQAGDDYLLVEYGDDKFDLNNLYRVSLLEKAIHAEKGSRVTANVINTVVGCNSLMVYFNSAKLKRQELLSFIRTKEDALGDLSQAKVPCRKFRLPISYKDKAQEEAIKRYMETQRPYAPYLPDNLSFVAESNAMTPEELKKMLLTQELMAFNVGFLCGSTVFLPIDPRYRIVSPKANPSRVYTPAGSVSWGGSCMAIYPADSPGGFQMLGRSIPYFDMLGFKKCFSPERPWLYENFDIITFFEVSDTEMEHYISLYHSGRYEFQWETFEFDMQKHNQLLRDTAPEVQRLKEIRGRAQQRMIQAENESLEKWNMERSQKVASGESLEALLNDSSIVDIAAPLDANVWKINVQEGDILEGDKKAIILEAMKLEIAVTTPTHLQSQKLRVEKILVSASTHVQAGAKMLLLKCL